MAGPHKAVKTLRRGDVAALTGLHLETVRYYETAGLLPAPPRGEGGQRLYGPAEVKRLSFIRRCRELGFTLDEIRALLQLVDGRNFTCDEIKAMTLAHVGEIHKKIADLRRMERILKDMAAKCDRGAVPECPIVDALSANGRAPEALPVTTPARGARARGAGGSSDRARARPGRGR
jgi:MerR family mercuric resistance operon transcriptional regulator